MSRNSRGKKAGGGAGTIIIILILFLALQDELPLIFTGAATILGGGILFLSFAALIVFLFIKLFKGNKNYTEQKPRANKNPYSNGYSQDAVNKEAAEKAAGTKTSSSKKKEDVVIDGTTVKEKPVEEPKKEEPKHKTTGDPEIDKMIMDRDLAIEEMKRLDEAIIDEKLSEQIVHLEQVTDKIVNYIIENPKKKKQVGKFFSYYLPTTLKLLNAYDRMDDTGISGSNIDGTKGKIEDMMDTALTAFDKQLDALFADEALDVSTDITVMENMLKAEGLTDDNITLSL